VALQRDPRSAIAWSGLGTTLFRQGRAAEAIDALKRATTIEPKMVDAWYGLGRAYQQAGQSELSRQAFDRAERLRVAEPDAANKAPAKDAPQVMRPAPAQEPH
jgi:Flp pilus assembly protein TadD